jgi:hypothetical protein
MWASPSFDSQNALGRQRAGDNQQPLVFFSVDVVRDDDEVVSISHRFAEHFNERCLA